MSNQTIRVATSRFKAACEGYESCTDGGLELEESALALHAELHTMDEGESEDFAINSGLIELLQPGSDREPFLSWMAHFGLNHI